jgi:hypothetical protein
MKRLLVGGTGGGQLTKLRPKEGKGEALATLGQASRPRKADAPTEKRGVERSTSTRFTGRDCPQRCDA